MTTLRQGSLSVQVPDDWSVESDDRVSVAATASTSGSGFAPNVNVLAVVDLERDADTDGSSNPADVVRQFPASVLLDIEEQPDRSTVCFGYALGGMSLTAWSVRTAVAALTITVASEDLRELEGVVDGILRSVEVGP